ncbi:MAG: ABC transporter substrate-binding protein [Spirochaetia bacterium]|nr:ABC transporter substrate-binding protein [Spirochaetia bacterium]
MRRKFRSVFLFALVAVLFGIKTVGAANILKIGLSSDEGTLNPYTYKTETGIDLVRLVYDPLFQIDKDLVSKPWLVKSFALSENNLLLTMKLHENVKWHDGKVLTSADVKFTYEYIKKYPKSRFTNPAKNIIAIETPDVYTVTMRFQKYLPDMFYRPLADMPILPKHIWEKIDNPDASTVTVGSGAFIVTDMKPGEMFRMKANKDFFLGAPDVDEIVIPLIKDTTALFTALKAGSLDITTRNLSPELIKDFSADKRLKIIKGSGFATTMVYFNNERVPFNRKEFRQALAYAINRKEIVDVVILGVGTVGSMGFVHPVLGNYNNKINQYEYDLDKAKNLLDALGFTDRNKDGVRETDQGKALEFKLLVYANNPLRVRAAELMKESFAKIGVKMTITALDMAVVDNLVWPDFDAKNGRDYDMTMWGWGASSMNAMNRYVEMLHSDFAKGPSNHGAFKSPAADAILDKLSVEVDFAKRDALVVEMQSVLAEEVPFVTLYYADQDFAYNPKVKDSWVYQKGKGPVTVLSFVKNF